MSEILSYFGEIIIITAISGILFTVAPEGNIKKYINFIISVCVLAAIVAPMFSVVSKLPEKIRLEEWKYEEAGAEESEKIENAVINASKKEIESAICSLLSSKFDLDAKEIACEIELDAKDPSNIEITEIRIVIPAGKSKEKIRNYIDDMFLGKSVVVVSEAE